jgi:hypothetical protein
MILMVTDRASDAKAAECRTLRTNKLIVSIILLNPAFAAAAMAMSSVSVLTNSLRLRRFRPWF